jgi:thiamine pyrophosphate-dependent acetolactate synthase large subunit-like protein
MAIPGTLGLHLDLDLSEPVADGVAGPDPERQPVLTLDPSLASLELVVVVGPGVVRSSSLEGLRSFSRAAGAGVVNTWGAKGVERWNSPFHFGTAGLQERDFELAGLGAADIVVVSGLDPDESPLGALGSLVVQEVPRGSWAP